MKEVFEKPEDMSEYLFRIVDNGGSSADRYTVAFSDGSYLSLSASPSHPQGVSMSGEGIDPMTLEEWVEEGEAVDLALGDLPPNLVDHILFRNNEGMEDFMEALEKERQSIIGKVENYKPVIISPTRDAAEANEGDTNTAGKGIYLDGDKFMVKMEGGPDDRGPYDTAREVILATLPDQYSLSGPEYHSSVDLFRMTPDPAVLEAVAALEARRDAEWKAEMERRYP
jgi:hypothetical protein